MAQNSSAHPETQLFASRIGASLTANNVRRLLRHALTEAGLPGISPHMFRRTVATVIYREAGLDLAADLLGHTDQEITIHHYIRRNELVDPVTANLLERAFGTL